MTSRQRKQRKELIKVTKELIKVALIAIGTVPVILFAMFIAYQVGVTM